LINSVDEEIRNIEDSEVLAEVARLIVIQPEWQIHSIVSWCGSQRWGQAILSLEWGGEPIRRFSFRYGDKLIVNVRESAIESDYWRFHRPGAPKTEPSYYRGVRNIWTGTLLEWEFDLGDPDCIQKQGEIFLELALEEIDKYEEAMQRKAFLKKANST